jgi:hypothetical protein
MILKLDKIRSRSKKKYMGIVQGAESQEQRARGIEQSRMEFYLN